MSAAAQLINQDQPAASTSHVTGDDAASDRSWFLTNPKRRYRARRGADGFAWIIRRRPEMALLRARSNAAKHFPDNDEELRAAWVSAAWPELTTFERKSLINHIKSSEH